MNSKENNESKYRCKNVENRPEFLLNQEKWHLNCQVIRLSDPIHFKQREIKRCSSNRRSNIWKKLKIFNFDQRSTRSLKKCSDRLRICMNGTIKKNKISKQENFKIFEHSNNNLNIHIIEKSLLILKNQKIKRQISLLKEIYEILC